ncbi:MAG: IPT/TIG domain-containing protein [Candidatus Latescibacterota bacterium]
MLQSHLFRSSLLSLVIVFVFFLPFACSKKSSPTGPGDNGNTGNVKILEMTKQKVEPSGGTIPLKNGASVVIPAGALGSAGEVTVSSVEPSGYFDGAGDIQRMVLSCSAPVTQFAKEVEIRVPLPSGMTGADSSKALAGLIDEATGAVTIERSFIRMESGKPVLILPVTHFSSRLLEWFTGPTPPPNALLNIPYYGQGSSQYCWAASVQMVTQATSFKEDREIWDIIGRMGVDEGGITDYAFRTNSTLSDLIKERTGIRSERMMWDYVNANQCRDYLRQQIGNGGRPVAFFNGPANHAVVVVGYDGGDLIIHDPASTSNASIGYTALSWQSIMDRMGSRDKLVTLVIPASSLDSNRPDVTVNIMNGAFEMVKPKVGTDDVSRMFRFGWDHRTSEGYAFVNTSDNTSAESLPGHTKELKQAGDIEIVNSSRTESRTVSVWVDISSVSAGSSHFSYQKSLTLGPNSIGLFKMSTVPVDSFRYNAKNAVDYRLSVSALVNSQKIDEAAITFTLEPEEITLASLFPNTGPAGSVATLTGTGFGACRSTGVVSFNGVQAKEILSWKDTEIKVKVPAGAATGNVVVTRDEMASNGVKFTISQEQMMGDTYVYTDDLIRATTTWEVTGTGMWTDYGTYSFYVHPRYDMEIKAQGSMRVTFSAELAKKESRYTWQNGDYTVTTYHPPVLKPLSDPEVLDYEGEFPKTYSLEGQTFTAEFTFTEWGQYFSFENSYHVPYDIRTYTKDGVLKTELLNQVDKNIVHTACRVVCLARQHLTRKGISPVFMSGNTPGGYTF